MSTITAKNRVKTTSTKATTKVIQVTPVSVPAKKNVIKTIPLANLKLNFFVRVASNEDRILQFAMKYESDGIDSLPPIKVTKENEIIDGRHRYHALQLASIPNAKCEVIDEEDTAEILFLAFSSNMGGALPPESKDIELVMRKMLQEGVARKDIITKFTPHIGAKAAQTRANYAQSHLAKMKTEQALRAIRDESLTVPQAATLYGVAVDTLRAAMGGKSAIENENRLGKIKAEVKTKYRSGNSCVGQYFKVLMIDLQDGVVPPKEVREFIDFCEGIHQEQALKLAEWKLRLDKFV